MDLQCACPGMDTRYIECERQATAEDGLCDECRANDCPNSPLSWYSKQIDQVISEGEPWNSARMDEIRHEYERRCKERNVQP